MAGQPVDRSVSAADRTLAILDAFIDGDGVRSLGELETATGLFKSVICRYMLSFERQGYLYKRPDGRYQLGTQALRLGRAFERGLDLAAYVMPLLNDLVAQTRESASFYVQTGNHKRLCLYRVDSPFSLRVTIQPGTILPLDDSATGQVLADYAHKSVHDLDHDTTRFLRVSANNTGTDHTASLSVPVFGTDGYCIGALTLSGPTARFDPTRDAVARKALLDASLQLGDAMGNPNPGRLCAARGQTAATG